jgi:hypothetical protein
MRNFMKGTVRWCNQLLFYVLVLIMLSALVISSLVIILISPLIAFAGANEYKLGDNKYNQGHATSASWWQVYKDDLIFVCTKLLPMVAYKNSL